jgi:hypothetical protein
MLPRRYAALTMKVVVPVVGSKKVALVSQAEPAIGNTVGAAPHDRAKIRVVLLLQEQQQYSMACDLAAWVEQLKPAWESQATSPCIAYQSMQFRVAAGRGGSRQGWQQAGVAAGRGGSRRGACSCNPAVSQQHAVCRQLNPVVWPQSRCCAVRSCCAANLAHLKSGCRWLLNSPGSWQAPRSPTRCHQPFRSCLAPEA